MQHGRAELVFFFFKRVAWVDLPPGPFDLLEFSRLLLLDFHRRKLEDMEAAAIGIMEGEDPIQGCREILRQAKCLIVIDGLQSICDWDLIETTFLSQPTRKVTIIVITTEESIAKHSAKKHPDQLINVKCLEDGEAYDLFKQVGLIALKHCPPIFLLQFLIINIHRK